MCHVGAFDLGQANREPRASVPTIPDTALSAVLASTRTPLTNGQMPESSYHGQLVAIAGSNCGFRQVETGSAPSDSMHLRATSPGRIDPSANRRARVRDAQTAIAATSAPSSVARPATVAIGIRRRQMPTRTGSAYSLWWRMASPAGRIDCSMRRTIRNSPRMQLSYAPTT